MKAPAATEQSPKTFLLRLCFCAVGLFSTLSVIASATNSSDDAEWRLVWSDEFEQSGLPNSEKWDYDIGGHGWGNKELQHYTSKRAKNARVDGGRLIIEARKEPYEESDYTSARLVTRGLASWTYGRFEISAKLPSGKGTWPAIWMLPSDWNFGSGAWPGVGEIDIMEHVGYDNGTVHATTHSQSHNWVAGTQKSASIEIPDANESFHVYALEWNEDEIKAFVDGKHYYTYRNERGGWESWPFQRDFYLILNIAVGGTWGGAQGVDSECFPQRMEIDYVRVYQRPAK